MKRMAIGIALIASQLVVATPALSWDLLATRDVRDRVERDSIALRGDRRFDRIRLCVRQRVVHFLDVKVRFANGQTQDVHIASRILPGQCTRAINLQGDNRNIASVDLIYEANSVRNFAGATVRLFGE
jgi:hypothetical protein